MNENINKEEILDEKNKKINEEENIVKNDDTYIDNKDINNKDNHKTKELLNKLKVYAINNKLITCLIVGLIISVFANIFLSSSNNNLSQDYYKDLERYQKKIEELQKNNDEYVKKISELEMKIEEASYWYELTDEQREVIIDKIEEWEEEEEAKIEAEKKAQEELQAKEEAKKLEEEKKKEKEKYNTGITYNQIARNPDEYMMQLCKFKGKVLQVSEGPELNAIRLAVNGDYDKVIYIEYDPKEVKSRILENDTIEVSGISMGIVSYTTVLGANVSVPSMLGVFIDIK